MTAQRRGPWLTVALLGAAAGTAGLLLGVTDVIFLDAACALVMAGLLAATLAAGRSLRANSPPDAM